ncbi:MAG TPA: hypothetical protein VJ570_06490 [Holophagaceae bacterium]|nr:hypothetical protein [Holophagaceae bacterium]
MHLRSLLLPGLLLGLALACGGSSSRSDAKPAAPAATGLVYTDPTGTGWRLIRDASSTGTRVVLNLVGPTGLMSRGAGFNLVASPGVRFGKFETGDRVTTGLPIRDTGVYFLLNTTPSDPVTYEPLPTNDPLEPKLLAGGVKAGNLLTAAIFQKDRREPAKDSGAPLCQIALEFDAAAGLRAGDAIPMGIVKAKFMSEDVGAFSIHPTLEMASKAHLTDMTLALGSLRAQ